MIILASQSPFRKHALDVLGIEYKSVPSGFDESSVRSKNPRQLTQRLAEAKARKAAETHGNSIIVASDLVVVNGSRVLGKPETKQEAFGMLKSLSAKTFLIITGLAVYNAKNSRMLSAAEPCKVKFRKLEEAEIKDYISRYPVLKCAGSFEADGLLRFAERIEGSYNFRAGMPVDRLVEFLRKHRVRV